MLKNKKIVYNCLRLIFVIICFIFIIENSFAKNNYELQTGKTTIPFRLYNNLIVVPLQINDTTYNFIFDSGCKQTFLLQSIEQTSLRDDTVVVVNQFYTSGLGSNDSIKVARISNNYLKFGAIENDSCTVFCFAENKLQISDYLGVTIHGIFGADIFANFYVYINYNKQEIIIQTHPFNKQRNYTKIPLDISHNKGYYTTIIAHNNHTYICDLLLDTGANIPIILKNIDPKAIGIDSSIYAKIGEGLNGDIYAHIARVDLLFLNQYKLNNIITAFHQHRTTTATTTNLQGNIGNDVLSRFSIYYSYPDSCIYIKPTKKVAENFYFQISNILVQKYQKSYKITHIIEQSAPYCVGLRENDIIVKINNYDTQHLQLQDVLNLLNNKFDRKIKIQYIRDGRYYHCTYRLWSLI